HKLPPKTIDPKSCVKAPPKYQKLLDKILEKTAFVKDLEEAFSLHPLHKEWTFITLQGEILHQNGAIFLGISPENDQPSLSQKSELNHWRKEQTAVSQQLQECQKKLEKFQEQFSESQKDLGQTTQELQQKSLELVRIRSELERIQSKIYDQHELQEQAQLEWDQHHSESLQLQEQKETLETQLNQLEQQSQQTQQQVTQIEQTLQHEQSKQQQLQQELTQLKVKIATAQEQLETTRTSLAHLQAELNERSARFESHQKERGSAKERREKIQQNILTHSQELEKYQKIIEEDTARLENLEEHLAEILRKEDSLKTEGENSLGKVHQLQADLNEFQLQKSRLEVRLEELLEKVQENLEINLPQAAAQQDFSHIPLEGIDEKIEELNKKLKHLGHVNFEALDELKELEERYQELKKQEQDLTRSKKSLNQIIHNLNQICQKRFLDTFEQVRSHFQTLFRRLFGGGKADIFLENEDEVLESGIEIIAKPPGKEPRSITLLSGGERTLTTVALLFAMFQSNPSPFCLLDEVDAALDETNIERFLQMLQGFLESCQFIIVSHSRQTIANADVIYGVTMEESGVSKNVSLEFKQLEKHFV
ncbi:MAG: hypothetical protein D6805_09600, partial [Planctomycetota bacterium]